MPEHLLAPETPDLAGVQCPAVEGRARVAESYAGYAVDESRLQGDLPERIYFPTTTLETAAALAAIRGRGETVTVSGARTGIAGGAVNVGTPNGLSLERLAFRPRVAFNKAHDAWCVRAGAGMTLAALLEVLRKRAFDAEGDPPELSYPVDPTETSASLGGTVATNASGARTLGYGPTRDWVLGLTAVLADGRVLHLARGEAAADGEAFGLRTADGSTAPVALPRARMPATKHVAGYVVHPDMDLVDLFVGGEGTLGVVTEVVLRLRPLPGACLYLCVFLDDEARAPALVRDLKADRRLDPVALEYMDSRSLDLLRAFRDEQGEASGVPPLPDATRAVLYLEVELDGDAARDDLYAALEELLARHGVDTASTWAGFTPRDLDAMKRFRHALPERVNALIGARQASVPGLTKVGTDMAVPDDALPEMLRRYRETLDAQGLEYVIFGHIGNGHVHVNILPRTLDELRAAKAAYAGFARAAVDFGGSVAAEHGIGRLKKSFMAVQYNEEEIAGMRALKDALDPAGTLNPGVLF
jgi:D-lactate dehydrogenase (cytochrome)